MITNRAIFVFVCVWLTIVLLASLAATEDYKVSSIYNLNDSLIFTVNHSESIFFVRPPTNISKSVILLDQRLGQSLLRTPCQVNRTHTKDMCSVKLLSLSPCVTVFNKTYCMCIDCDPSPDPRTENFKEIIDCKEFYSKNNSTKPPENFKQILDCKDLYSNNNPTKPPKPPTPPSFSTTKPPKPTTPSTSASTKYPTTANPNRDHLQDCSKSSQDNPKVIPPHDEPDPNCHCLCSNPNFNPGDSNEYICCECKNSTKARNSLSSEPNSKFTPHNEETTILSSEGFTTKRPDNGNEQIRFNTYVTVMKIEGNPPEFTILVRSMSIVCENGTETAHHSFGAAMAANLKCQDKLDKEDDPHGTELNSWYVVVFEGVQPAQLGFVQRNVFVEPLKDLIYVLKYRDHSNYSGKRKKRQVNWWTPLGSDDDGQIATSSVWKYPNDSKATFTWSDQVVMTSTGPKSNDQWQMYSTSSLADPDKRGEAKPDKTTNADSVLGKDWQHAVARALSGGDDYPQGLFIAMIVMQVIAIIAFCAFVAFLLFS